MMFNNLGIQNNDLIEKGDLWKIRDMKLQHDKLLKKCLYFKFVQYLTHT